MISRRQLGEAATVLARNRAKPCSDASSLSRAFARGTSSQSSSSSDPKNAVQTMRDRFQHHRSDQAAAVWESLWKDQTTPWDLGGPTRVLEDELETFYRSQLVLQCDDSSLHKTQCALVPGCGAGYDLALVARFYESLVAEGFLDEASVIGLDFSRVTFSTRPAGSLSPAMEDHLPGRCCRRDSISFLIIPFCVLSHPCCG